MNCHNKLSQCVLILFAGVSATAIGQTTLTSGVPVAFQSTNNTDAVLNGKNGYVIAVPTDPFELAVTAQLVLTTQAVNVYVRCGADVSGDGTAYDAVGGTGIDSAARAFVFKPAGGGGNCYIALQGAQGGGPIGRLTATISPIPQGTQVTVSSLAYIYLAGQPGGTKVGVLSAPSYSPVQAPVPIVPGQALNIIAGGLIGGLPPEGNSGLTNTDIAATTSGAAGLLTNVNGVMGLSEAAVPHDSLIGVFVGDSINGQQTPPNLGGDLRNARAVYPLLQQVFYIGNGVTTTGQSRVIVVPAGATRLFLASSAAGLNASGSFTASISIGSIPSPAVVTNPGLVPVTSDLYLIDQPLQTSIPVAATGSEANFTVAEAPYDTPVQAPVPLTSGNNIHIRTLPAPLYGAEIGAFAPSSMAAQSGLSAEVNAKMFGVFVGDKVDSSQMPGPFTTSPLGTSPIAPGLQQLFPIYDDGTYDTSTPPPPPLTVTVPAGATRLFFGFAGGGFGGIGVVPVLVTPDNPAAPQISAGGVVTNAGYSAGPVSPGSLVAIFGTNFGPTSSASTVPLPTTLGNTQVFFNNVPAPLFYVSPTQIVAEVPFETLIPVSGAAKALVTVVTNGVAGIPQRVALTTFAPGIFTTGTGDPVIVDYNTGQLVSTSAPASRGDTLVIYATGLGSTLLDPVTGSPAPLTVSPALLPIQVTLKGSSTGASIAAPVAYAGLAPGFIGVDQLNVQIPSNAPTGTVIVQLASAGIGQALPYTIGIQ